MPQQDFDSPITQVRILIGDTTEPFILQDDFLEWLIVENSTPRNAAIKAVMFIISSLSKRVDEEVGDVRVRFSQMLDNYRKLLDDLTSSATFGAIAMPIIGGTSRKEIRRVRNNPDTPSTGIEREMFTENNRQELSTENPYLFIKK